MKQVLFLAAIYALIFHQSNKNTKNKISFNQKKVSNNIVRSDNNFNGVQQNPSAPFGLNDNAFATFVLYKPGLYNK